MFVVAVLIPLLQKQSLAGGWLRGFSCAYRSGCLIITCCVCLVVVRVDIDLFQHLEA